MSDRPNVAMTMTQFDHRVPGGSGVAIAELARSLVADGSVSLTAVLAGGDLRHPLGLLRKGAPSGVPAGSASARMSLPLPILYDSWRHLGRPAVDGPVADSDLLHVTVPVKVGVRNLPVVATVHDVFPLTRPDESTRRGAALMAAGLRWIRDTAAAVMVPTERVRSDCIAVGFDPSQLTVVRWGARPSAGRDAHVAPAGRDDAGVVEGLGIHGAYVLFVGTVEPRKNLPTLIEAMRRLDRPGVALVIAGASGWGPNLSGDLAGVASPVRVLGHVADADLAALRRRASVVCVPSLAEGFGLPVLEAMAAGVPTITSADTACAEVGGGATIAVPATDADAWTAAIASVLDDAAVAADLAERGVLRAGEFTWDDAARRTVDVYRSVLS